MEGTEIKEDVKVEGSEGKDAAGKVQAQAPAGTEAGGAPTPPPVVAAADPIAELRDKMAAEQARIAAVRAVCGDDHADLCAKAIKEGWDANRTELQVLRDNRPKAPSVHAPDNIVNGSVLEAACMLTAKLPDLDKRYDERTLDQADKRFGSGIHLQELLLEKHRVKPR